MAKADDIRAQLELTQQLNKALERQAELQAKLNTGASKQAQLMGDMANAASKGGNSGIQKRLADQRKLTAEIENTRKKSADMTNELQRGMKKQADSIGGAQKAFGGIGKFMTSWKGMALGAIGGILGGVTKMMSGITGLVKGAFAIITSVVKSAMGVIKALIMAPFKLMDAFNGIANEMLRIQSVINGARQSVRGMIGDHEKHGSISKKAYEAAGGAIKKYGKGLYDAHEQGTAQRMKDRGEMIKFMGVYKDQLKKGNEVAINMSFLMRKAMGMSTEDAESLTGMVKAYGGDLNATFKQTVVGIGSLSDKMGLDIRVLTKNFMAFHNKLKPATGMSNQRLQVMSATFMKLGIDAGKALSMFDKFDTLEGGAEVVSKMSRSLGIHLSQTQMIMAREKGPLEQMKLVQQSMRMAGKSMEDLSYDGKKMLAEMFGGDEAAAMKAFGAAGIDSTESIEAAAEAAAKAKKAKDLPAIMKSVQRSIQGVANSFGKIMKPLEAFMHGFMRGMNDGKFTNNMKIISKIFEKMGTSFGLFFKETGLLEKISGSLARFAEKIKHVMPLVEELLSNLFTDQPKSSRSAFEVIKEISSTLLGAYSNFYNDVLYFVIGAAQKVIPVMIKMAAFLAGALNDVLTGSLTGDFSDLSNRFEGAASGVTFDDERLNKSWRELGEKTSTTFNDEFMKKSKRYVATDGKMKLRQVGLGEALIDNMGLAFKKGLKKLGKLIWEGVTAALKNIPTWVYAAVAGVIAMLFIPGAAVWMAIGAGVVALGAAAWDALNEWMSGDNAKAAADQAHENMKKRTLARAEELRIDVAKKVAATKGLLAQLDGLLAKELYDSTPESKEALKGAQAIIDKEKEKIEAYRATAEETAKINEGQEAKQKKIDDIFKKHYIKTRGGGYGHGNLKDFDFDPALFTDFNTNVLHGMGLRGGKTDVAAVFEDTRRINIGDILRRAIYDSTQTDKGADSAAVQELTNLLKSAGIQYGGRSKTAEEIVDILDDIGIEDDGTFHLEHYAETNLFRGLAMAQPNLAKRHSGLTKVLAQGAVNSQEVAIQESIEGMSTMDLHKLTANLKLGRGSGSKDDQALIDRMLGPTERALSARLGMNIGNTTLEMAMENLLAEQIAKKSGLEPGSPLFKKAKRLAAKKAISFQEALNDLSRAQAKEYVRSGGKGVEGGVLKAQKAQDLMRVAEIMAVLEGGDPAQIAAMRARVGASADTGASVLGLLGKGIGTKDSVIASILADIEGQSVRTPGAPGAASKAPGGAPLKKLLKPGKAGKNTVMKKGAVGVKAPSKAKKLGALPASVLKMLGNKRKVKQMFDAGLEITSILEKMQPAADAVSKALNSNAVPAMNATADASQQATEKIAGTVVMLGLVRDKLNEIQTAYQGIMKTVVDIKKEGDKLKGQHSADIKTATGTLKVEIKVEVNSNSIASALEKTPVVTWSGALGPQEDK